MNTYDYYITPEEYEIAAQHGISECTLNNRVRGLGWSKDRAMTTPTQKKRFYNSKWVITAEKNGICYSTFKYRVNKLGWSEERAATQPLQNRKKQAKRAYEASRKYPKELIELAKKNGIGYDTFRQRVYSGWDWEEAAMRPLMTPREIGLMTKEKRQKGLEWIFMKREQA